jgi:hypothetical protein
MRYHITPPVFTGRHFKTPLIELPKLGPLIQWSALQTMQELFLMPARPGLMVHEKTLTSGKGRFSMAWTHQFEHGYIAVMSDMSALIFARSDDPDLFEMLPLTFRLARHVPAASDAPQMDHVKLVFAQHEKDPTSFGVRENLSLNSFQDIRTPKQSPDLIGDTLRHVLSALEDESLAWVKAYRKTHIDRKTAWPIALSRVSKTKPEAERANILRFWLTQICTHAAKSLNEAGNMLSFSLSRPIFNQSDGSMEFDLSIEFAGEVTPKKRKVGEHLLARMNAILEENSGPFDLDTLFARVPIDDHKAAMADAVLQLELNLEAFSLVSLSNHEALKIDAQVGLRQFLAEYEDLE